jgi:cytochrome oxidase Cu insertion factor (SCO1/SenC/PrrC family)
LRVIAVSVDPKRDTRAAIRTFLAERHAGRNFHYVNGSRAALASVWRNYHVAALPGPAGTVSHSAVSILIDPLGRERFLLDSQLKARDVLAAMN